MSFCVLGNGGAESHPPLVLSKNTEEAISFGCRSIGGLVCSIGNTCNRTVEISAQYLKARSGQLVHSPRQLVIDNIIGFTIIQLPAKEANASI